MHLIHNRIHSSCELVCSSITMWQTQLVSIAQLLLQAAHTQYAVLAHKFPSCIQVRADQI